MKCLVLGGGVIGVTSAYYLAQDGHEVTLVERNAALADEASYANAGLMSPGHAFAWAQPSMRARIVKAFLGLDEALTVRPQLAVEWWRWGLAFLGECTATRFRENTRNKYRVCQYSHDERKALGTALGLDYSRQTRGSLYLFRHEEKLDAYARSMALLAELGVVFERADRNRCAAIEPALEPIKHQFVGAIYAPNDESGSCAAFTRALGEVCRDKGVDIRLGTAVRGLEAEGDRIVGVATDRGRLTADTVVLAAGAWSTPIARTAGIRLPVQPIKGYSVTVPIDGHNGAPTSGGIDEERYIGYSRQGDRLRIAGSINYVGFDTEAGAKRCAQLVQAARALFPDGAAYERAEYRACLRPQTPDGPPILGPGPRYRNLYFNVGQGSMGWSMSCGSSRVVADLIAGRRPAIDMTGLGWRS
ncbi:MAG: D-amino acid dehydrogenase [Alphaproteobacteria bacterium]